MPEKLSLYKFSQTHDGEILDGLFFATQEQISELYGKRVDVLGKEEGVDAQDITCVLSSFETPELLEFVEKYKQSAVCGFNPLLNIVEDVYDE